MGFHCRPLLEAVRREGHLFEAREFPSRAMLPVEDVFMRKEGASELAFFLCSGVDVAAGLSSGTVAALASLLRVRPLLSAHDAAGLERLENR